MSRVLCLFSSGVALFAARVSAVQQTGDTGSVLRETTGFEVSAEGDLVQQTSESVAQLAFEKLDQHAMDLGTVYALLNDQHVPLAEHQLAALVEKSAKLQSVYDQLSVLLQTDVDYYAYAYDYTSDGDYGGLGAPDWCKYGETAKWTCACGASQTYCGGAAAPAGAGAAAPAAGGAAAPADAGAAAPAAGAGGAPGAAGGMPSWCNSDPSGSTKKWTCACGATQSYCR